jgi:Fic family protein
VTCTIAALEDILLRVKSEFLEMPGLRLTLRQAERLWGLDQSTCEALIETLTEARFLQRTREGAIVRRSASV